MIFFRLLRIFKYASDNFPDGIDLVFCFTSQATAIVMSGRSVHLTTFFPGQV